MEASNKSKLDPRLRRLPGRRPGRAVRAGEEDKPVHVFIEVANKKAAKWVEDHAGTSKLVQVVDGYYTAMVEPRHIDSIASGKGVIEVEKVRFFRPQLHQSVESIHGRDRPSGGGAIPDGTGVVIGIVDYGLDVTLKDFQHPNDQTRVEYLWDQDLDAEGTERPPENYGYGVEYSSKDINAGPIRHDPLNDDPLVSGHGTHVAGIAAGNGRTGDADFPAGTHVGVAPGATLVFVNLKRRAVLAQVGASGGTIANSIELAHGIAYCFEKAEKLGMPCVVNLSLGFNGGGHDGNMAVEWIIDTLLRKPGRAVVIAAGNEDGTNPAVVYAAGSLKRGEEADLEWEIGREKPRQDDSTANELEVWYPKGSGIKVSLVAPGDRQSSPGVTPGRSRGFSFAKGEELVVHSDKATPWNGDARIHIELNKGTRKKGIRAGTWIVKLKATRVASEEPHQRVRFDAWIEREAVVLESVHKRSRFSARHYDPNTAINLTTPSTARRAITVASYVNDGSARPTISGFSGRGPTRDGRYKPELAAPGQHIVSTNARAGEKVRGKTRPARVEESGTSMAAPHVAGVVARMLSRNAYLTAEEIRDILVKSAIPPLGGARWNSKWGYGLLDAARAVDIVEQQLDSRRDD